MSLGENGRDDVEDPCFVAIVSVGAAAGCAVAIVVGVVIAATSRLPAILAVVVTAAATGGIHVWFHDAVSS